MTTEYYKPDRKNACFRSALANVLVALGDEETAQMAYDKFVEHRWLKGKGSVSLYTASQVVSDLTNSKYMGVMYTNNDKIEHLVSGEPGDGLDAKFTEEFERAFKKSQSLGRVTRMRDVSKIHENLPTIVFTAYNHIELRKENGKPIFTRNIPKVSDGHAMAYVEPKLIIDNGIPVEMKLYEDLVYGYINIMKNPLF
ncbi:MAG: hypothetical protein ABIB43_05880 [archaeon]